MRLKIVYKVFAGDRVLQSGCWSVNPGGWGLREEGGRRGDRLGGMESWLRCPLPPVWGNGVSVGRWWAACGRWGNSHLQLASQAYRGPAGSEEEMWKRRLGEKVGVRAASSSTSLHLRPTGTGWRVIALRPTAKGSAGKQEFYHRLLALLRSEVSGLPSIAINHRHIHNLLGFY